MMLQSLKKVSNATNLKFLAIFLMFLDHIHEMFSALCLMWANNARHRFSSFYVFGS